MASAIPICALDAKDISMKFIRNILTLTLLASACLIACIDKQYQNNTNHSDKKKTALSETELQAKDEEVQKINELNNKPSEEALPDAAKEEQIQDKVNPEFSKEEVLFDAIQKGDLEKVKTIIEGGFVSDINLQKPKDNTNRTLLIEAVLFEQIAIVEYLINKGATIELKDAQNKSALDYASEYNNLLIIKLLKNEALTAELLKELLIEIVKTANPKVGDIKFVLNKGLNPNYTLEGQDISPIFEAARNGSYTNVLTLIENGADVNFHVKGKTALNGAISKQKIEIIALIFERGGDPTIPYINRGKEYPPREYAMQLFGKNSESAEVLSKILDLIDKALKSK